MPEKTVEGAEDQFCTKAAGAAEERGAVGMYVLSDLSARFNGDQNLPTEKQV